jgi:hypothetical protein
VPLFRTTLDSAGNFTASVQGCVVSGIVNGTSMQASSNCDGVVTYNLPKSDDNGSGASFAGVYEQSSSNLGIQSIITPEGDVFFNYQDSFDYDTGRGTIQPSGNFSVTSDFGGTVTGTASAENGELTGNYTNSEGTFPFNMKTVSTRTPTAISISATQGLLQDRIEIDVEVPDLRSPYGSSAVIVYMSYSDQFADSFPTDDITLAIGGHAPGTYKRAVPSTNLLLMEKIRAPRIYFWAVLQTSGGLGAPIGPTSGWASNRDSVPTIYLPVPDPEGAGYRSAIPEGTAIGSGLLGARANLPGVFNYSPSEGTILAKGNHAVDIEFIPSIIGYQVVQQSFQVTVVGADELWIGTGELSDGWRISDWFGSFNPESLGSGWLYHAQHGWLYAHGQSETSVWLYDQSLGWLWTNGSTYPLLYSANDENWIFYYVDSSNPRRFYQYSTGQDIDVD